MIYVNSARPEDTCVAMNGGQTQSMCSVIVLNVHREVARNEVLYAIFQVDRLWGLGKENGGNEAISEWWNVLIEIQRCGTE